MVIKQGELGPQIPQRTQDQGVGPQWVEDLGLLMGFKEPRRLLPFAGVDMCAKFSGTGAA